ncbi:MAG: type II toxin-antitoxin system RelE/ParE family toxin [Proteobacteria bacterium]|nr:type II toxin-antitoxin system RelE/ParE family toxin [Pseudomonadota bacterium]NOG60638.1 type II toxin-antitoxin system RelE/ParE family toxin [Pseudomonadota bacterium]
MAEIRWTYEAELWLKDIYEYIALDNPTAAEQVIDGIYNKAQILKDHPELGHKYEAPEKEDVRILLYGHYRITYVILNNRIDILGVFHGSLDIDRYL